MFLRVTEMSCLVFRKRRHKIILFYPLTKETQRHFTSGFQAQRIPGNARVNRKTGASFDVSFNQKINFTKLGSLVTVVVEIMTERSYAKFAE